MSHIDIPRSRWQEELDGFSRQHEGWIVRIEVIGADGRMCTEARDLPLQGISVASPDAARIAVGVGQTVGAHVTHEVSNPVAIQVEQTEVGAVRGLRICANDGSTTTLEFRSPMRPEDVDGMPA